MAKKTKISKETKIAQEGSSQTKTEKKEALGFPFLNKLMLGIGIGAIIIGFIFLQFSNAQATNFPAICAPIFILSGILIAIIAFLIKSE